MLAVIPLSAQTFDVVSIKPNTSGASGTSMRPEPGGQFAAINTTARMLLRAAFGGHSANGLLPDSQIVGGPNWMGSDRFDIRAKGESVPSIEGLGAAILAMLDDRFQLKTHREVREVRGYALVAAKTGLKLKSVDAPLPPAPGQQPPSPPPGRTFVNPGAVIGSAVRITQLVDALSSVLGQPVIDKTGLSGFFDFKLEFTPEEPPGGPLVPRAAADEARPSIFTAVQEQLGLRLDPIRTPVEVVVVDTIQRPTGN
jgi:uncharacterized protein (TIGR03435 family)